MKEEKETYNIELSDRPPFARVDDDCLPSCRLLRQDLLWMTLPKPHLQKSASFSSLTKQPEGRSGVEGGLTRRNSIVFSLNTPFHSPRSKLLTSRPTSCASAQRTCFDVTEGRSDRRKEEMTDGMREVRWAREVGVRSISSKAER